MNIRENTLPVEVKKDGLSQLQDGSWVLKLKVHPNDMKVSLMQAPMGTRYMAALVEMNHDETIKEQPRDHGLSQQCGILCGEPRFLAFLWDEYNGILDEPPENDFQAADAVRKICQVDSRAEFDSDPMAGQRWRSLKAKYEAWKAL